MKKAFTTIEIIIITALLGILVAIALPAFQNHVMRARESAAKDSLRIVRSAIELYAAQNNGIPPGYPENDTSKPPGLTAFWAQIVRDGKYINDLPENPFNKFKTMNVIADNTELQAQATGDFGWIYKPQTMDYRIDWPGKDSEGINYYDY